MHSYAGPTNDCADPSRFPTFDTGTMNGAVDILIAVRRREIRHSMTASASISRRSRHGQGRTKEQSGGQEAQKREDQDHCRDTKPKARGMAARRWVREKDIMRSRLVRRVV